MSAWAVRLVGLLGLAIACGPSGAKGGQDAAPVHDGPAVADGDGDRISDADEGRGEAGGADRDSDGDGTPDYLDEDSDDDGVPDYREAGDDSPATPPTDSDGDGTPDFLDLDSDGDSIPDEVEAAPGLPDTDGDGFPDYLDPDSDGDGLSDFTEAGVGAMPADSDGDGVPDYRDLDSDADGMSDETEGAGDFDGDGMANPVDPINDGAPVPITLTAITTPFNQPIGIDYHEPTNSVVMSVNYSAGMPLNFERIEMDGTHEPFSTHSGLTNEVKIATARSGNPGGFVAGDLFVGNGADGQIVRITDGGATIFNPWADLPGDGNGLLRGSLFVDRTGVFAGDLVAVTTLGQVWRVTVDGIPTLVATTGVHLEGVVVVPDAPARYGPLAGRLIAGAENESLLYAVAPDGTVDTYELGVKIEDIDLIAPGENFFGVNYGTSRLLGAPAMAFLALLGDILLAQEMHASTGLYRLQWNGMALAAQEIPVTAESAPVGQWEHVTFAPAGIVEIPPIE
jgi:hypothetical protein